MREWTKKKVNFASKFFFDQFEKKTKDKYFKIMKLIGAPPKSV